LRFLTPYIPEKRTEIGKKTISDKRDEWNRVKSATGTALLIVFALISPSMIMPPMKLQKPPMARLTKLRVLKNREISTAVRRSIGFAYRNLKNSFIPLMKIVHFPLASTNSIILATTTTVLGVLMKAIGVLPLTQIVKARTMPNIIK
jgi:hypothetical protein